MYNSWSDIKSIYTELSEHISNASAITFSRSSGPGGQNVNKVNSKVTLKWNIQDSGLISDEIKFRFLGQFGNRVSQSGEVVIISDRSRDQNENVKDCLAKLMELLKEVWTPPKARKKTKPSKSSKRKRVDQKRHLSKIKKNRSRVDME